MFTFIKDGKALGSIHIAAWAEEHEAFAAQELSRYLQQITGAEAPVRRGLKNVPRPAIVLADLSRPATAKLLPQGLGDGLRYDGVRLKTAGGRLYIVSHEPSGVVFGAYEYLRRFCDCAFLDCGERGETVPRRETVAQADLDVLNNPACWYRGMQTNTDSPRVKVTNMVDWMAKHGFSHLLVHLRQTPWEDMRAWLLPEITRRGIKLALGHHIFAHLIPPGDYLGEHPEYFSQIGKKRVRTYQLSWCLSNPDLVETVSNRVIDLARKNPQAATIELWPDDGVGKPCECADCAKLDGSSDHADTNWDWVSGKRKDRLGKMGDRAKMRRYLHLANAVADRLSQVYPKLKLSILSYADLSEPPARDVYIHPNIIVCLALYWRCSKHTLTDPRCIVNRQYVTCIREWLKVLPPESFYLYTYECGMGAWVSLPYPILHCLFPDWEWLKALGIGGTHIQSHSGHMGVYGINYAAVARLLRDGSPSMADYVASYCRGFFGAAAGPMAQLILKWEACMARARARDVRPSAVIFTRKVFSRQDVDVCRRLCGQALALTEDPVVRWRVERMRGLVEYCELYRNVPPALEKYIDTRKASQQEMAAIRAWIRRNDALIRGHMRLDDDIFPRNFAERMMKKWGGEI